MTKRIDIDLRFEKILGNKFLSELENKAIFQNSDGSYELFNHYCITKTGESQYLVTTKTSFFSHTFYSLKNAVIWCTYDKRNKFIECIKVIDLDRKLSSLDAVLVLHKKLFARANTTESKMIYVAKLNEEKLQKNQVQRELNGLASESRRWQLSRFNNQTN
jgi:hypothetical protein